MKIKNKKKLHLFLIKILFTIPLNDHQEQFHNDPYCCWPREQDKIAL